MGFSVDFAGLQFTIGLHQLTAAVIAAVVVIYAYSIHRLCIERVKHIYLDSKYIILVC